MTVHTARRLKPPAGPSARTPIGNGTSLFLDGADGRSTIAKRFREVFTQLVSDMGGDPSEAQTQILRRAAALSIWAEAQEARLASGADFDASLFSTASNSLHRLLAAVGLERRAVEVPQTLRDYLASHTPDDEDGDPDEAQAEDLDPETTAPAHAEDVE